MKRGVSLVLFCLFYAIIVAAQRTTVYDSTIKTVALSVGDALSTVTPVLRLESDDVLNVSFDQLSHDYHRYTYRLRHLDAEFHAEDGLFESDYVQATADEGLIETYTQSMNTTQLYTHYAFSLPNKYLRPLLSGNYELTVFSDDEDDEGELRPLFRTYFYVTEEAVSISASATSDTEIDRYATHQQLSVSVAFRDLIVRDASREIRLVIVPNDRPSAAVVAPAPTGQTVDAFLWEHCRALIFPAGNEYRKFEMPSTRYPGLHVDGVRYFEPYYHATLMGDALRPNYLYDEDQNGRFVPLAEDGEDADTGGDYLWAHFSLQCDEPFADSRVYVNGRWTSDTFISAYELHYNAAQQVYEGSVFLKQGYYSYQYVVVDGQGHASPAPVEGDFFQTENEYAFLVYYRQAGARYDRLVGYRTVSFKPQ